MAEMDEAAVRASVGPDGGGAAKVKRRPKRMFGHGTDASAAARKAGQVRRDARQAQREQRAALQNVGLLEARLRKQGTSADVRLLGTLMLDQMRRTAITAVELADLKAREQGHAHGLADLMANDLMRKPTETLAAWSKFLPMNSETADSNASLHLEAVRALSMATQAAGQAVAVMAGKAGVIVDHAVDALEVVPEALENVLKHNSYATEDCVYRNAGSSRPGNNETVNAGASEPSPARIESGDDHAFVSTEEGAAGSSNTEPSGLQLGCRVGNISDISKS
jgi:hypothetical protein